MADLIRLAERIALILMSGSVIWRLWPALSFHPQIVLLLASELSAVFFLLIQRKGSWATSAYTTAIAFGGTAASLCVTPGGISLAPDYVTAPLILVGTAIALAAKEDRGRTGNACRQHFGSASARIEHPPVRIAPPRAGAEHEPATCDRCVDGRQDTGPCKQVRRPGSTRGRLRIRIRLWTHQHERGQPHVLHRARRRPDVARVAGVDQDDADGLSHRGSRRNAGILPVPRAGAESHAAAVL